MLGDFSHGCRRMSSVRLYDEVWGIHSPQWQTIPAWSKHFPVLKRWQRAAALEVVYEYLKEGKVLDPFPASTRCRTITGHPLFFYPFFVVPKSKPGCYRWVLNALYNKGRPSVNDRFFDYSDYSIYIKRLHSLHQVTNCIVTGSCSLQQIYVVAKTYITGDNMKKYQLFFASIQEAHE